MATQGIRNSHRLAFQAFKSTLQYCALAASGSLHVPKARRGNQYLATDGKVYTVFRETVSDARYKGNEVIVVIGFRLAFIGSSRLFHWIFQRVSLLDTPVWVGFPGFRTKFWMVDPLTKDYLGIYRYQGEDNAEDYAEYICSVLRYFSVKGSIWHEIINDDFELYMNIHAHK